MIAGLASLSSVRTKRPFLTLTEPRVLLGIVDVVGVPEVAASRGVAETTIKTHLGRLFEKTRAGRQADMVKIVAGFATPLLAETEGGARAGV